MWFKIVYGKNGMPYNYSEFICDTDDDIATLPTNVNPTKTNEPCSTCSIGSKAFVIESKFLYMLNNEGKWKFIKATSDISDGTDELY